MPWTGLIGLDMTNQMLDNLIEACADAEILWRKRRQHSRKEIDMGNVNDFDEVYCTNRMKHYRELHDYLRISLDAS
jgi:hypothetical protein